MSRRHKKKRGSEDVQMSMAAMLDMAFQLLTFFILTFKPAPTEGQVELRMPPPQPVTGVKGAAAGNNDKDSPLTGMTSLVVSVTSNASGGLGTIALGETAVANLASLNNQLASFLGDNSTPFEQVLIQVGSGVRYDAMMSVVDICTQQKLASGEKLSKLSFVELPENGK